MTSDTDLRSSQPKLSSEPTVDAKSLYIASEVSPAEWHVGDIILDVYEIKRVHEGGSMGRVYRIYHREWNTYLAVKSPRTTYFKTETQKQNFVRECLAWIGLGVHPHIVTCHYVRTLGGIPRVFAEYAEGGTLKDCIRDGLLYREGPEECLRRLLQWAIQIAAGLHFAHTKGLVHQDVKPANVLLATDGIAKVSDFGLAKARTAVGETSTVALGINIEASYGGMTPAYCSPEQARKQTVTHRTDIWSWGLSVLEMFVGGVQWQSGVVAADVLDRFLARKYTASLGSMPDGLVDLLRSCFREEPEERPDNFHKILVRLVDIYRESFGCEYEQADAKPVEGLADILNNQAISLLELGLTEEAAKYFDAAVDADPHHPEALYNRGLYLWRSAKMTDIEVIERLNEAKQTRGSSSRIPYLLGLLHLERLDVDSGVTSLKEAQRLGCTIPIDKKLILATVVREQSPTVRRIQEYKEPPTAVCLSGDALLALTAYEDKTMRLWDINSGRCLRVLSGYPEFSQSDKHNYLSMSVALNQDGRWALSACGRIVRFWDTSTGECMWTFEDTESIRASGSMSLSKNGRLALWEGECQITSATKPGEGYRTFCLLDTGTRQPLLRQRRAMMDIGVALSPDSRQILSGFADSPSNKWIAGVVLWDVATGKELSRFSEESAGASTVTSVAFSSDGQRGLSGSMDKTVRLWDIGNGEVLKIFKGNSDVLHGSYGTEGQLLLVGETVQRVDVASGRCMRTFDDRSSFFTRRALSHDGRLLISARQDGSLELCDVGKSNWFRVVSEWHFVKSLPTSEIVTSDQRFESYLRSAGERFRQHDCIGALADARIARAVSGREKDARMLDLWTSLGRKCRRKSLLDAWLAKTLKGHSLSVSAVALSLDGKIALSGSSDTTIRVWDTATGNCVRILEGHSAPVNTVALTPDGIWALSGSGVLHTDVKSEKTIKLWHLPTGKCHRTFAGQRAMVKTVAVCPMGRLAISGSGSLLDEVQRTLLFETSATGELIHNCSSKDNEVSISFWDVKTGKCLKVVEDHRLAIQSVAISQDGQLAISGSLDRTVRLWDVRSGSCRHVIGVEAWVDCVALDLNTRSAFFKNTDSSVCRYDIDKNNIVRIFDGHRDGLRAIAVSVCGHLLFTGGSDKKVKVWDTITGNNIVTFQGHDEGVTSVAINGGADIVLSGSDDGTVRLWQLDWDYEFPGWADWNEGARSFLDAFLETTKSRVSGPLRRIFGGITHEVKPQYSDSDFDRLLATLSYAGYGWLRPDGVKKELELMRVGQARKPT